MARCSIRSCQEEHYARGHCKKHYTQILRHGRLMPERERGRNRECEAKGCDRASHGTKSYCRKHYRQMEVHGRLTPEFEHQMGNVGCLVPGCQFRHRARGLCAGHYNRVKWRVEEKRYRGKEVSMESEIKAFCKEMETKS